MTSSAIDACPVVLYANDEKIDLIPCPDVNEKEHYTYLVNQYKSTGDTRYVSYDDGEFRTSLYKFSFPRDTNVSLTLNRQSLGLFFVLDEDLECNIRGVYKGILLKDHFNMIFTEDLSVEFAMRAHKRYTFFGVSMTLSFLSNLDSFPDLTAFIDHVTNGEPALLVQSGLYLGNEAREFIFEIIKELTCGIRCKKMHIRTQVHRLVEASLGQADRAQDKDSALFEQVKAHINTHLATVTVVSLEEKLKMSPLYLRTLVKRKVNMKPVAYIIQCRMEKGLALLAQDLTLLEIARQVGYSDQSAFSKAFVKWFGKWPTQVRNERRETGASPAYFPR